MRTCDVCQKTLGVFNKFRYADGYICKECYKKASNHFAETIVKKNLSEIKALCEKYEETQTDEFKITGKIGNFLLIDELEHKAEKRQDGTVNYLKVKFWITGSKKLAEISLISNPARIKSYAFRQSLQFAKKIEQEIKRLTSYEETEGGSHEAI